MEHIKGAMMFGSARFKPGSIEYEKCYDFVRRFCKLNPGVPVITGGGPGIMQAANKAAQDVGNPSIGYPISFAPGEPNNPYIDKQLMCDSMALRKSYLMHDGLAYFHFAGGYGTQDELYEVMTLQQLNQADQAPIFLVGRKYWKHVVAHAKTMLEYGTINQAEFDRLILIPSNAHIILDDPDLARFDTKEQLMKDLDL